MSKKKPGKGKTTKQKAQEKAAGELQDEDLEKVSGGAFDSATKQASTQAAFPDASGWKTSTPYPSIDASSDDSDSSSSSSDDSSSSDGSSSSKGST